MTKYIIRVKLNIKDYNTFKKEVLKCLTRMGNKVTKWS